ncbi:MAG: hypothetical protein ACOYJD_07470 [Christensenellales bacterium]|jgi:hypothetical protein
MILLAVIAFAVIAAMDVPRLIALKRWKDVAVYGTLFAAAFALVILQIYGQQIPSPIDAIEKLFREVIQVYYEH